jgi:hypothetical protein
MKDQRRIRRETNRVLKKATARRIYEIHAKSSDELRVNFVNSAREVKPGNALHRASHQKSARKDACAFRADRCDMH